MEAVYDDPDFSLICWSEMCARHPRAGYEVPAFIYNPELKKHSLYINAYRPKYKDSFDPGTREVTYHASTRPDVNAGLVRLLGQPCDLFVWFGGGSCYEARVKVAQVRNVNGTFTLRVLPYSEVQRPVFRLTRKHGTCEIIPNPEADFDDGEIIEIRDKSWSYDAEHHVFREL